MGKQAIEFGQTTLFIDDLQMDGSSITLSESSSSIPKVGEPLPPISITTIDGKTIDFDKLGGRVTLFDFWATWCRPCVEKFAYLKELGEQFHGKLDIITINVDKLSQIEQAKNILKEYHIVFPQVMNGKGQDDPIWRLFGAMGDNRLGIPFFVLIDQRGKIFYAGNGGSGLSEINKRIEQLLEKEKYLPPLK